jgi:hypothetical protein
VLPIDRALPDAPSVVLDAVGAEHARQGRSIALRHVLAGMPTSAASVDSADALEPLLVRAEQGPPIALARCVDATLTIVRGLHLASPSQ